jgi:hypothetical protein
MREFNVLTNWWKKYSITTDIRGGDRNLSALFRQLLLEEAGRNLKTLHTYSYDGYGQVDGAIKILEEREGHLLSVSTSTMVGETKERFYVWTHTYVQLASNDDQVTIYVESVLPEFAGELFEGIKENLARKPPQGQVTMLAKDGGYYLVHIGKLEDIFEPDNYSEENVKAFNTIVQEFSSNSPPGRLIVLEGLPGTGKAQPLDAEIITPKGIVKMQDICVNDLVTTPTGGTTRVTQIHPQGKIGVWRVTFDDGTSTECSLDHLWLTQNRNHTEMSVKPLSEIISTLHSSDGHKNHSVPLTQPVSFKRKRFSRGTTFPIDPYLMGVLLGDGCFCASTPRLSSSDTEIFKKVEALLPQDHFLSGKEMSLERLLSSRQWHENHITDALRSLGLWGLRSTETFIPDIYKFASVRARIALLQGLMDTDGSIYEDGKTHEFSTSSERLSNDFQFVLESLGIYTRKKVRIPRYPHAGEFCTGEVSFRLYPRFQNGFKPYRLSRKLDKIKERSKYLENKRFISNVEYIGEKEAQCITVENPSGLYLTNNFITTHNSYYIRGLISASEALYIYVPAAMSGELTAPEIIPLLIRERERDVPMVLIMEDADSTLVTRASDNLSKLSDMLNMTDGLLGDLADIRIIATTNAKKPEIDPAVMRPGRLAHHLSFKKLPPEQAQRVYTGLIKEDQRNAIGFTKDLTLAEVYRMARKDGWTPPPKASRRGGRDKVSIRHALGLEF